MVPGSPRSCGAREGTGGRTSRHCYVTMSDLFLEQVSGERDRDWEQRRANPDTLCPPPEHGHRAGAASPEVTGGRQPWHPDHCRQFGQTRTLGRIITQEGLWPLCAERLGQAGNRDSHSSLAWVLPHQSSPTHCGGWGPRPGPQDSSERPAEPGAGVPRSPRELAGQVWGIGPGRLAMVHRQAQHCAEERPGAWLARAEGCSTSAHHVHIRHAGDPSTARH